MVVAMANFGAGGITTVAEVAVVAVVAVVANVCGGAAVAMVDGR